MNRVSLIIALLAPAFCLAQQPSTQPAAAFDPQFKPHFSATMAEARITLAPGIPVPPSNQWREALATLRGLPFAVAETHASFFAQSDPSQESERALRMPFTAGLATDPQALFPSMWEQAMHQPSIQPVGADPIRAQFFELITPEMMKLNSQVLQQLRTFVRSDPSMSAEQRSRRIAEITSKIDTTERQMQVLQSLAAAQPDAAKRLAEKVHQLYDQQQGLQMRLSALKARRDALQMGLKELQVRAEAERDNDPVVEEMKKIVALHEQKLQRVQQMAAQGVTSSSDLASTQAEVAEARLRLLERQSAIGKGGKGELMDRLTDELAMVSIDSTDLQIQLAQLRDEITKTDPAKLTADGLADLLKRDPALDNGPGSALPPLYNELQQQVASLRLEWLKLVVEDVELVKSEPNGQ